MSREVYFALLIHGRDRLDASLKTLRRATTRWFGRAHPRGVVIDNQLSGAIELELDGRTTCIAGDNQWREFSGWDRGLAWLDAAWAPRNDDVVILANDTIQRYEWREYLEGVGSRRVTAAVASGALLGRIDEYPEVVRVLGLSLRRWLCTSFFVATPATLDRLRPLALAVPEPALLGSDLQAWLSADDLHRRYLRSWLLGEGGALPRRWHGAAPLTSANAEAVRGKLRAILCEQYLSARAQALGLELMAAR
jgi:hypothetical protein